MPTVTEAPTGVRRYSADRLTPSCPPRNACALRISSTGAILTAAVRASTPGSWSGSSPSSATTSPSWRARPTPSSATRAASSGSRASTSTGRRTPSGSPGPMSCAPRSTCGSSPSCAPPGSPSRTRSASGPAGCSPVAEPTSTSCTTTSASGAGCVTMMEQDGWPMLATLHHPITVDRDLDLAHARGPWRRATLHRWYGFLRMQMDVARRIPRLVTVSESSKDDISDQMGVDRARLHVVPVGVDPRVFRPIPTIARVPGRIMTHGERRRPDEGPRPPPRRVGEAADRARRRAPRGHRPPEAQERSSPGGSSSSASAAPSPS